MPSYTAIDENQSRVDTRIYPNPSADFVMIDPAGMQVSVSIYDQRGALVYTTGIYESTSIDVRHLPAGIYMVNLSNNRMQQSFKLMKK